MLLIIWFIIVIYLIYDSIKKKKKSFIIPLIIFSLGFTLLSFVQYSSFEKTIIKEKYTKIVSLERGSEINGEFTLGFGTISTSIRYYAYYPLGKNQYELVSFGLYGGDNGTKNLKLIIEENNEEEPRYSKKQKCKLIESNFFVILTGDKKYSCKTIKRILYVPEDTIQKKFNG